MLIPVGRIGLESLSWTVEYFQVTQLHSFDSSWRHDQSWRPQERVVWGKLPSNSETAQPQCNKHGSGQCELFCFHKCGFWSNPFSKINTWVENVYMFDKILYHSAVLHRRWTSWMKLLLYPFVDITSLWHLSDCLSRTVRFSHWLRISSSRKYPFGFSNHSDVLYLWCNPQSYWMFTWEEFPPFTK